MSMNVSPAYQLRHPQDLWPLVHDIRLRGTRNVRARLRAVVRETVKEIPQQELEALFAKYRVAFDLPEDQLWDKVRKNAAKELLTRGYREASTSLAKSPYDFDVSVGFRSYSERVILIPYVSYRMRNVLSFLDRDERLNDYHYQNRTDPPEDVPAKTWKERRDFYGKMLHEDCWDDLLHLTICDFSMFYKAL